MLKPYLIIRFKIKFRAQPYLLILYYRFLILTYLKFWLQNLNQNIIKNYAKHISSIVLDNTYFLFYSINSFLLKSIYNHLLFLMKITPAQIRMMIFCYIFNLYVLKAFQKLFYPLLSINFMN